MRTREQMTIRSPYRALKQAAPAVIGLFALMGCDQVESERALTSPPPPWHNSGQSVGVATGISFAEQKIFNREAEYAALERELITRGVLAGAVKGGLIGFLVAEAPGAAAGLAAGGAGGYFASKYVATSIIREHRDYLARKASLESIIAASQEDRRETEKDIRLMSKYTAERSGQFIPRPVVIHPFSTSPLSSVNPKPSAPTVSNSEDSTSSLPAILPETPATLDSQDTSASDVITSEIIFGEARESVATPVVQDPEIEFVGTDIVAASLTDQDKEIAEALDRMVLRAEQRFISLQEIAPIYETSASARDAIQVELQEHNRLLRMIRESRSKVNDVHGGAT